MIIPIKTHISPNLRLESRQEQLALTAYWICHQASMVTIHSDKRFNGPYEWLDREELILLIDLLHSDCARLRRELDEARGIIRG